MARTKKTTKRHYVKRDDLQWRISNSLLVFVLGLLLIGYGAAYGNDAATTGFQVAGNAVQTNGYSDLPAAYMYGGVFLVALSITALIFYKKR